MVQAGATANALQYLVVVTGQNIAALVIQQNDMGFQWAVAVLNTPWTGITTAVSSPISWQLIWLDSDGLVKILCLPRQNVDRGYGY